MSSADNPTPPDREEFENPLDVIPIIEKTKDSWKFLNTRKAVMEGGLLYSR